MLDADAAFNVSTSLKQAGVETLFTDPLNLTNAYDNAFVVTTLTDKNDSSRVLRDNTVLNLTSEKVNVSATLSDLTDDGKHVLNSAQTALNWRNLSPYIITLNGNEFQVLRDGVARVEARYGNDASVHVFDVRTREHSM